MTVLIYIYGGIYIKGCQYYTLACVKQAAKPWHIESMANKNKCSTHEMTEEKRI